MLSTSFKLYSPDELDQLPPESQPDRPAPDPLPCPECTGERLIYARWSPPLNLGWPGRWEQAVHCEQCHAAAQASYRTTRLVEALNRAGVPRRYRGHSLGRYLKQGAGEAWDHFRHRLDQRPGTIGITTWNASAAATLRAWITGAPYGAIFLAGPVGGGKSALLAALVQDLIAAHLDAHYDPPAYSWITEPDLWDLLRQEWRKLRNSATLSQLIAADLVVLDDLGTTEQLAPWQRDAIEALICGRYNADRPVFITSNLPLSAPGHAPSIAGRYGERVASRLIELLGGRRLPGYREIVGYDWRSDRPHTSATSTTPEST